MITQLYLQKYHDTSADTVELSIKIDPAFAVLNNPFSPVATSLKSSSLPTHVKIKSAPSADGADFIFTCVGNDDDLREVATGENGLFNTAKAGSIFIDNSTVSAEVS